ncbi:MAG: hypothetical protein RLY93_09410 [Sumerlaeia bacterium]
MRNTSNSSSDTTSIPPPLDAAAPPAPFPWRWLAAVLLTGFLVSSPSLLGGFHADDWFQVRPRSLGEVFATFSGDWNSGGSTPGSLYRPLIRVTFWIDEVLWGPNPLGYHMTNHALFLALLAGVFVAGWKLTRRSAPLAALAALWVACFPPSVEAVAWLSGRTDLQTAAALLWSLAFLLIALERASWRWLAASAAAFWAALFSKEIGIAGAAILPLAVVLLRPRGLPRRFALTAALLPIASGIAYLLLRRWAIPGIGAYHDIRGEALTIGEVLRSWLTYPAALAMPLPIMPGQAAYPWQGGAAVIAGALVLLAASRFSRPLLLSVLSFLFLLLPMWGLGVAPMREGRLLLLPVAFAALGLAGAAGHFFPQRERQRHVLLALALTVLPLMGLFAALDQAVWARARAANERALDAAFAELLARETPADFVFLEPPYDPAQGVRLPGRTGYLALQTMWQWEHPGAPAPRIHLPAGSPTDEALLPLTGGGEHRLRPALAPPSREGTIVLALQPGATLHVRTVVSAETYPLSAGDAPDDSFTTIGPLTLHSTEPILEGYTLGVEGALVYEVGLPPGQLVLTGEGRAEAPLGKAAASSPGEAVLAYPLEYWGISHFFAVWPESPNGVESIRVYPALQPAAFQLHGLSVIVYIYDTSPKGNPPPP